MASRSYGRQVFCNEKNIVIIIIIVVDIITIMIIDSFKVGINIELDINQEQT